MTVLLVTASIIVAVVAVVYVALGIAVLILKLRLTFVPDSPLTSVAQRLLIVAPHPGDDVIIGAGQAMRTVQHRGAVHIVWLTTGVDEAATSEGAYDTVELGRRREQEARAAWSIIGLADDALVFLRYAGLRGLVEPGEVRAAIARVGEEIERLAPDRVVVTLYEGGHYQHDVANLIVARALAASSVEAELFEAPVYNCYYSWRTTPRKLIALLGHALPGTRTDGLSEGVDRRSLYAQPMNDDELAVKRRMLGCYASRESAALMRHGVAPDRLLRYVAHDYRRPPFDYDRSPAARLDRWRRHPIWRPLIEPLARRVMPLTRTIHPDPSCRITTLPVDEIDAPPANQAHQPEVPLS
jgi:LmbE family N-acetylglucosaminyl deacetylase